MLPALFTKPLAHNYSGLDWFNSLSPGKTFAVSLLPTTTPRVQGGEHVKTMSPIHSLRDFFHSMGIVSVKPRNASECGLVISAVSVSTTPEHKSASSFKQEHNQVQVGMRA